MLKRLLAGSALRLISLVANVAIAFYMMPFVIASLGDRWYGLWTIVGTLTSYYGFLDLGLASATQRFFATSLARNERRDLNTVLVTALVIFSAIALAALIITGLIVAAGPLFLKAPGDATVFRIVAGLLGLGVSLSLPTYVLTGLITANLRYDQVSYIQLCKLVLRSILFVWALRSGHSIITLAVIAVGVDIFGYALTAWLARRVAPWMDLDRRHFSAQQARALFSFGIYAFITSMADKLRFGVSDLVLAAFSSLSMVTHYTIAVRFAEYLLQALGSLLGIMTPIFARSFAERDHERLREQFLSASRVGALLGCCAGGACIVFGRPFIELWMGPAYLDAYIPLVLLVFAMTIDAMQIPTVNALFAVAKHKFFAWMTAVDGVVNVLLSILLVRWYGMIGVALGTAIPMIITKLIVQPWYVTRALDISLGVYVRSVLVPALALALIQVPLALLIMHYRIASYSQLALLAAASYACVFILAIRVVLSSSERSVVWKMLPARVR